MIPDLSILIPARQEEFLQNTIDDIFRHAQGDIEVLVAIDNWDNPPEITVPKGRIIRTKAGQRGATNRLAELSQARYVMKLDAHCSLSQGFDSKMLEDMNPETTLVPSLHNLHAYDWICENGHRSFQGKYEKCEQCGSTELSKETVWKIKSKPSMVSYYFDTSMHFQYSEKQAENLLSETMSIQGSCFMVSREKYWELQLCDEKFGSWGSQGIEVALKTWLSGGRVMSTKKAFYGHQFRETEGFPYLNPSKAIFEAQDTARNLFLKNAWPKQARSIQSIIEKFGYEGDWTPEKVEELCTPYQDRILTSM